MSNYTDTDTVPPEVGSPQDTTVQDLSDLTYLLDMEGEGGDVGWTRKDEKRRDHVKAGG